MIAQQCNNSNGDPMTTPENEPSTGSKVTEIAVVLPGADAADDALVDQLVARLNQTYRIKGLETAREVAGCVIELMFAGSAEQFLARGNSHMSFKALKKRKDLQVSYQFVWSSCAVYGQLQRLPAAIADELPLSHHKMLLPIKDDGAKVGLATAAVEKGLSKRDFEVEVNKVKKEQKGESNAGRPALPAFAKAFGKLEQIVKQAKAEEISAASFTHFSKDAARELLTKFDDQLEDLKVIAAQVQNLLRE